MALVLCRNNSFIASSDWDNAYYKIFWVLWGPGLCLNTALTRLRIKYKKHGLGMERLGFPSWHVTSQLCNLELPQWCDSHRSWHLLNAAPVEDAVLSTLYTLSHLILTTWGYYCHYSQMHMPWGSSLWVENFLSVQLGEYWSLHLIKSWAEMLESAHVHSHSQNGMLCTDFKDDCHSRDLPKGQL